MALVQSDTVGQQVPAVHISLYIFNFKKDFARTQNKAAAPLM